MRMNSEQYYFFAIHAFECISEIIILYHIRDLANVKLLANYCCYHSYHYSYYYYY